MFGSSTQRRLHRAGVICRLRLAQLPAIVFFPTTGEHHGNCKEGTGEAQRSRLETGRAKVAGQQAHEVSYEAKKSGTSASEVKAAVKSAGNSRKAVEKKLSK